MKHKTAFGDGLFKVIPVRLLYLSAPDSGNSSPVLLYRLPDETTAGKSSATENTRLPL